jgi:hypothetical protein
MALRPLIHDTWLLATALQVLLVGVLLIRRMWSRFPIFTAYACCNLLEAALAYVTAGNGMLYFYSYWLCEAVTTVLGLAIVYEVFTALFAPHAALRRIARMVFRWGMVLLVLLGIVVIATEASVNRNMFGSAVMVIAEAARFVEVGLLMFLFLCSGAFGLHWRAHVFGIALGLGIFAAMDLLNVTLHSHFGNIPFFGNNDVVDVLNLTRGAAFCISVSMWAAYLYLPEHVASSNEVPKTAQLEQWNQAVMELISR